MAIYHPRRYALERPGVPAIIVGGSGEVVTYADLEDRANRFAQLMRMRGLGVGDHIAILMENNARYLEAAWGAQRSGLYYTTINSHLRAAEVQYILDDCGAAVLVTSSAMREVAASLDLSRVTTALMIGSAGPGFVSYEESMAPLSSQPIADESEGKEMLYSSGTTGRPKGIHRPLPEGALGDPESAAVTTALGWEALGIGPDTVYLSPAPLYHAAPLICSMAVHRLGGTVVVMEHFDAAQCLELIERYGVTAAQFVPTMFVRMLRLPGKERFDLSSLRFVVHAAAPCSVAVKRQMLDWWGPIIQEYYSGTEDVGSTWIGAEEWLAHPGSVGRPRTPAHIVGPDGQELPIGQIGTVYFEGGRPFEYHGDPEKTAAVTNQWGWRTLGDIGYSDEDGYLYLTDRQANMIISGGVNIYPQEAELVLAAHPLVADVAVFGVPNDEMGEEVKAVIELLDHSAAGPELEAELLAYCRQHLSTYKCPRSVDFDRQLPRDPNGKLYKRNLRDRYANDQLGRTD